MFLLNSRMGPFTAPPGIALEDPFSRSYGAMLPSSLTRFLSRALVSLYPPTCVGFGTDSNSIPRSFSREYGIAGFGRQASLTVAPRPRGERICLLPGLLAWTRHPSGRAASHLLSPSVKLSPEVREC